MLLRKFFAWIDTNKALFFIWLLGCVYLIFLLSSTQPDTFFAGDSGLKYLITRQIAEGHGFKYLYLPQPDWVQAIWQKGFIPLTKPFVYASPGGYIFSFPPAFQIISAVSYKLFGYKGLYIIPFTSALALWGWMIALLRSAGIDRYRVALALIAIIFCSPMSVYGVAFWEHMPAVLCLFAGIQFIVKPPASAGMALLLGLASGFATWLRPEAMVLNFLYGVFVLVFLWQSRKTATWCFLTGIGISVAAFFLFNYEVFGSPLGVHSYQIVNELSPLYVFMRGVKYIYVINMLMVRYFPPVLLVLPVLYFAFYKKEPVTMPVRMLLLITMLFCSLSPFLFPNTGGGQWGPRYFLPVMPVIVVALTLVWQNWGNTSVRFPVWVNWVLPLVFVYSLFFNVYYGGFDKIRNENFNRVKPAIDFARANPDQVIVVDTEHIPREMSDLFYSKYFFVAEDDLRFSELMNHLKAQGLKTILYVAELDRAPAYPNLLSQGKQQLVKKGNYYLGRYVIP